jgi:radical SAM superfamily enzyme YgiQ (UPF0313 family)
MPKVILVNPSMTTAGYSIITPRWLFVIGQATPTELVGDPVLIDESIHEFDPSMIRRGDIVGISITTGNCLAGYKVLRNVKAQGATAIMGGIHSTIFPDEPLEMGADAVVTGNGDAIWSQVVKDALNGTLQRRYVGGMVPGDALLKARWDLLDPRRYLFATVQTVAGCPENCSFCSVWVTDGRQPRQRLGEKIIEEVNQLYDLGFRYVIFADDNFNPATLGRIAREPSAQKRKQLEHIREDRLRFFDDYHRSVPSNLYAFTQMTTEVTSDEEYLSAMYHKMRIRAALVGIESFSEEGLKSANKQWNPAGQKMVETIARIQEAGIIVLSSIICGLQSDTVQTIRTMRKFAQQSGTLFAQFTVYNPYPGTKDYYELMNDRKNSGKPGFVPKHNIKVLHDQYWLKPLRPVDIIKHPQIRGKDLFTENKKCWKTFYSMRASLRRIRQGAARRWPLAAKLTYPLACVAFKRVYAGAYGMAADSVRRKPVGMVSRLFMKMGIATINRISRRQSNNTMSQPS